MKLRLNQLLIKLAFHNKILINIPFYFSNDCSLFMFKPSYHVKIESKSKRTLTPRVSKFRSKRLSDNFDSITPSLAEVPFTERTCLR